MKVEKIIITIIFVIIGIVGFVGLARGQEIKDIRNEAVEWFKNQDKEEKEINLSFSIEAWIRILSFKYKENTKVSKANQEKAGKIRVEHAILNLVGRIKTGKKEFEIEVTKKDTYKALMCLYDAFCFIADEQGDKDGKADDMEIKNLAIKYIDGYSIFKRVIESY